MTNEVLAFDPETSSLQAAGFIRAWKLILSTNSNTSFKDFYQGDLDLVKVLELEPELTLFIFKDESVVIFNIVNKHEASLTGHANFREPLKTLLAEMKSFYQESSKHAIQKLGHVASFELLLSEPEGFLQTTH